MKPYFDDGQCVIYHGDCREILPTLGTFDLLLTDPPYGHGDKWSGGTWASNPIYSAAFEWDSSPVEQDLLDSCVASAGRAIVWGGNYYSMPPSRCWLAWCKTSRMKTMADFELAWTNRDAPSKAFDEHRNPDGKRQHPTQKPLSLFLWCIGLEPAESVLDPFMGSGTTLRAAKDLGRRSVGIDLEERYCEIAAKRLSQQVLGFGEPEKETR